MAIHQTKQDIIDAAVRLFAEKGYDAVTTKEIAADVGITGPAIYNYFKSKADILSEIISMFGTKLKTYLLTREQVDKYIQTETPRQLLQRCIGRFTEEDAPFMAYAYRIVCREAMTNQKTMDMITRQTAASTQHVLDSLVERGMISKMNTEVFAMAWTQTRFFSAVIWSNKYFNQEAQLSEEALSVYDAVNAWFVDMAVSGRVQITEPSQ